MQTRALSIGRRLRATPFSRKVQAAGAKAYTVYNHMLMPTLFESAEADYWHLREHVQVWDVSAERQVELRGPDAAKLAQLMTPRDLSKQTILQGKYAPICDHNGFILNDPIIIKLAEDRFWLSIADSDIKLFAKGLVLGYELDVEVTEPAIFPLAVQGPKADELVARVFGEQSRVIRFFHGEMLSFQGVSMYVARSGWSKQGGFEVYVPDTGVAEPLWDALFTYGEDLNVRAGCPNSNERIESGLLSYGNDMDEYDTPFECGLDAFLNLDAPINSLSIDALRVRREKQTRRLVGLAFDAPPQLDELSNHVGGYDILLDGENVGEIRSQAWSYRYNKYLAFAMLQNHVLDSCSSIEIGGHSAAIHELPFKPDALNQT